MIPIEVVREFAEKQHTALSLAQEMARLRDKGISVELDGFLKGAWAGIEVMLVVLEEWDKNGVTVERRSGADSAAQAEDADLS